METTGIVLVMLLAVVASRFAARIARLPVPLVQIALGAAIFYSSLASADLDPEVFFVLLLPPLLFMDGWRIPKDNMFREAPTILTLALGLVCMRFAVAAALTGSFSLPGALASFLWVAMGGLAIGGALTWLVTRAHSGSTVLLGDDGAAQILLTLLIPHARFS